MGIYTIIQSRMKHTIKEVSCFFMTLYLLCPFVGVFAQSPTYVWARTNPGNVESIQRDLVVDALGNVYITGVFFGTVDFDPGIGVANITPSPYGSNAYIAKYDANGNYIWAKNIPINASYGNNSLAIDGSGNLYLTGFFTGTNVDFDPGAGTAFLSSVAGSNDIYIAKYDLNGNYLWAKSIGSTGSETGNEMRTDAAGNFFLAGNFSASVDFDPGPGTTVLTSTGSTDVFFTKYDTNGNLIWARQVGGGSNDDLRDIALDVSGNILLTGSYIASADFDPGAGTANLTSLGAGDIFIAKYSAAGNYSWALSLGASGIDLGTAIKADASGNVVVCGIFNGTIDFDPGAAVASQTAASTASAYYGKYDANGNYLWVKKLPYNTGNLDLALENNGTIFLSGSFLSGPPSPIDMDPGTGVANLAVPSNLPPPYYNIWSRYDSNGNYLWAGVFGHTCYCSVAGYKAALTVDNHGYIYYSGIFNGSAFGSSTVDFDPGAGVANLTASSSVDNAFYGKYGIPLTPLPVELISFSGENKGEENLLLWSTASEINNDHFDVERSSDGESFRLLGKVPGNGNSTTELDYSFTDGHPDAGENYYRLKQVDYDGTYKYSDIIGLRNERSHLPCLLNSSSSRTTLLLSCSDFSGTRMSIYNVQGVLLEERSIAPDTKELTINLEPFCSGLYLLKLSDGENVVTMKVIVN